jgi:hypothetical protein
MNARWWAGRVRQFARYVTGRVTKSERAELGGRLTSAQLELFDRMHRADQRHGLDVVAVLRRAGHADADLLVAGLLHDSGKGRDLHVWHRVGWSLAERYDGWIRRAALRTPTFKTAFATLAAHAERSAELALAAGCSPRTADLIRHQAEPTDEELGVALRLADEAS